MENETRTIVQTTAGDMFKEAIQNRTPIKKAHVSHNSGNNEWYTPARIIDAARKTMGGIDCDPASSKAANKTVGASKFYTQADNGLDQKWTGRVWMNPPYSRPEINQFSAAIVEKYKAGEVTEACVIVNNATETAWCQNMLRAADAMCFLSGRVKFLNWEGNPVNSPLQGQVVIYLGDNVDSFRSNFSDEGIVVRRFAG